MTTASVLTVLAGLVAVIAAAVYFFGIPDETKRNMERAALKTMGENKMSYMAKGMSLLTTVAFLPLSPSRHYPFPLPVPPPSPSTQITTPTNTPTRPD